MHSPLHQAMAALLPSVQVNNVSNEGFISPLHIAVWNQQAEAVRVLLQHKVRALGCAFVRG